MPSARHTFEVLHRQDIGLDGFVIGYGGHTGDRTTGRAVNDSAGRCPLPGPGSLTR